MARKDRLTFKYNHHLKAAFSVWATRRLTKRGVMRLKRSELSLFKAMTDASVAAVLPAEKAQPKRLSAAARVQQTVPVAKPTAGPGGVMDVDNVERTEEVRQQQVPLRQTFFGEPGSGNSRNKTGKARTKCGVCIFNACKKDCPVGSNRRDNCPCRHPLFPPSKGKWRVRDGPPTAERRARLAVPPPYSTTSAAPDLDLMDTS